MILSDHATSPQSYCKYRPTSRITKDRAGQWHWKELVGLKAHQYDKVQEVWTSRKIDNVIQESPEDVPNFENASMNPNVYAQLKQWNQVDRQREWSLTELHFQVKRFPEPHLKLLSHVRWDTEVSSNEPLQELVKRWESRYVIPGHTMGQLTL